MEEILDLSFDILLMMMIEYNLYMCICWFYYISLSVVLMLDYGLYSTSSSVCSFMGYKEVSLLINSAEELLFF